ncbi:MAG TPA: dienelactone hydrolase family protein [Gemmatimonadales bacterium]|nr:dienelactone hydrolase family protein [Gemmatimonadales bacterium]
MKALASLAALFLGAGTLGAQAPTLPADNAGAAARLAASPRHGEWVKVGVAPGDSVTAWVVYPERRDKAPVVVVIHEIFGLTAWVRGVADQLAADGFIAIAPDLLSGKGPGGGGTEAVTQEEAVRLVRALDRKDALMRLRLAGLWAAQRPAASGRVGAVGFCWGGGSSFLLATDWEGLGAAVVYYGSAPETGYQAIQAPVLGLYAGDDARVNATVPAAQAEMGRLGKRFEVESYAGAGHGFLRQQDGRDGANARAAAAAWPRTVAFFREALGA